MVYFLYLVVGVQEDHPDISDDPPALVALQNQVTGLHLHLSACCPDLTGKRTRTHTFIVFTVITSGGQ